MHGGQYAYADAPASVAGSYDPPSTVGDYGGGAYGGGGGPSQQYYAHAPPSDAAYDCAQRGSDAASTHYGGGGHGGSCQHGAPAASTVGDGGSEATFMAEALAAAHAAYGASSIAGDGLQPLPDDAPATPRNLGCGGGGAEGFVQVDAWENRHSEQQEALAEKQRARWNAALAKLATPPKSGTPPRRAVADRSPARAACTPAGCGAATAPPPRSAKAPYHRARGSPMRRRPPPSAADAAAAASERAVPPPPSSPPRRAAAAAGAAARGPPLPRAPQRSREAERRDARRQMRAETGELWGGAGQGDSSDGSDADEELPSLAEMTAPPRGDGRRCHPADGRRRELSA